MSARGAADSCASGIDTSVAIDHLRTQSWFGNALSEPFEAIASGAQHEQGWGLAQCRAAPEETPVPDFGPALRTPMQSKAFQPPSPAPADWYGDNDIALFAGQGAASPAIWAQRHDPSCPSEFYRGYLSLLGWISNALRRNPTLPSLRESIEAFNAAVKALPADERRNGASFVLMNVAYYAEAGTIPQILATLDAEIVCIAHCFIQNRTGSEDPDEASIAALAPIAAATADNQYVAAKIATAAVALASFTDSQNRGISKVGLRHAARGNLVTIPQIIRHCHDRRAEDRLGRWR